jgi:ATP-dependent helicase/nuclease subunit A
MTAQLGFDFRTPGAGGNSTAAAQRRNLVIEAGAGTGKTTAIVGEVLALLLGDAELAPERIVLVTFTEKAAGEIADRIHEALSEIELAFERAPAGEEIVWPIGSAQPLFRIPSASREDYRRACAAQLAQIESLRSQTIHSFCQTLLRQYPIEAGLDPQFKIIEGFERSLLYDELYDAWLDKETRTAPEDAHIADWDFLLNHLGYLFAVKDVIFALLERRDLLREPAHGLGDLREVVPQVLQAIDDVRSADARVVDGVKDDAARVFRHLRRTAPPREGTLEQWIAYFEPIAASLRTANLPKGKAAAELSAALKILRTSDKKGKSIYDRLSSHRGAVTLLSMTNRFAAFLDEEKRRLGVVDFDDLLLRTVTLLENPAVVDRVRDQYDYIFVDEFQDTDRVQARIIERLGTDGDGEWVPGKTILVGDPKQSIYGFRRADPETYYQMTERLKLHGARTKAIVDQYRSDPPLVDAINAIFACLFPDLPQHDPNVFRPPYQPLTAARSTLIRDLDARITFLHAEHVEKADRYFEEAEAIARWIEAHRENGPGDLRRFAILFRRLTQVDDYLDTFERHGIDYVLPPTRFFLDRRAAVDLLAVLRAIAYPFDRGAEISAARSPYFALNDDEIAAALTGDAPSGAWQSFRAVLAQHRTAAGQLTVSELISRLVESCAIERFYAATADGPRALRHLEHVRSIAFAYDQRTGGSVSQFVDEITHRRTEPDETEPTLIDESRNAVRILSVHAAKGLEFETVIIPDLTFRSSTSELELYLVEQPPSLVMGGRAVSLSANFRRDARGEKLKVIGGERDAAELRRLFYVAVTRAKSDVVFVCNTNPATFTNTGFWSCLAEVFGFDKQTFASRWTAGAGRRLETVAAAGTAVGVAFEKMAPSKAGEHRRRRLATPLLEQRIAALPLQPVELPLTEPPPRLLPGDAAIARAGAKNRTAGIVLHRILELWDGANAALEPLMATAARELGADADAMAKVKQRLATIARSPTFARLQAAETVARELPLWSSADDGAIEEQRIDRLLREGGNYLVVDYKSGRPSPKRQQSDREQVARYCRSVGRMTGLPCRGLLWYIDLERDEAIAVEG